MLHIVLLILKIVGIVLACLLGLVILILAALLFIPVTYRIDAHYHDNKIKAGIRVSWIGIVRACASYENELLIRVKALFFTLYSNDAEKNNVKMKAGKNRKSGKTLKSGGAEKKDSCRDGEQDNIFDDNYGDTDNKTDPAEEPGKADLTNVNDGSCFDSRDLDKDEASGNKDGEQDADIIDEKDEKKEFPIARFVKMVADKIKHIYRLIVDTIHNVGNAADNLKRKYEEIRDMINDEDNREFVVFLIAQLKALLAHIRPKKYRCDVTFGLEDPSALGNALMYISVAYGLLGIDINLTPVFGEKVIEADVVMKGRIRIFTVLMIALKVYRNKQFKKFISR